MSELQITVSERARIAASLAASLRAKALLLSPNDPTREALNFVKKWQAQRLARTHADFLASIRYGDAARFFLNDLYKPQDLTGRDNDLERLLPIMIKLLPEKALSTIVKALELDALSEQLDWAVAEKLKNFHAALTIDDAQFESLYAQAYCLNDDVARRAEQRSAVLQIGQSLEKLVTQPLLGVLLTTMAGPAKVAGLSAMHEFLMRGFNAFKKMKGAGEFLAQIHFRETQEDSRLRGL